MDGHKYDMFTMGLLMIELFTKECISKATSEWQCTNENNWCDQIYPTIFNILRKSNFQMLMANAYKCSIFAKEEVNNLLNAIAGCLHPNPSERPSAEDLLNHKLFGGGNYFDPSDVWSQKATSCDMKVLIKMYRVMELNKWKVDIDQLNEVSHDLSNGNNEEQQAAAQISEVGSGDTQVLKDQTTAEMPKPEQLSSEMSVINMEKPADLPLEEKVPTNVVEAISATEDISADDKVPHSSIPGTMKKKKSKGKKIRRWFQKKKSSLVKALSHSRPK